MERYSSHSVSNPLYCNAIDFVLGQNYGVLVGVGVSVAVAVAVAVEVAVAVKVAVAVAVAEPVAVIVGVRDAVFVATGGCELRRVMRGAIHRA